MPINPRYPSPIFEISDPHPELTAAYRHHSRDTAEKRRLTNTVYQALAQATCSLGALDAPAARPARRGRHPLHSSMDWAKMVSGAATGCIFGGLSAAVSYALAVASITAFYGGCAGIILTLPTALRAIPYSAATAVALNVLLRTLTMEPIHRKDVVGAALWGSAAPSAAAALAGGSLFFVATYWPVVIGVSMHAACSGGYAALRSSSGSPPPHPTCPSGNKPSSL